MSNIEERLRSTLQDLADETRDVPLFARVEARESVVLRRHRAHVAALATAAVAVIAAGVAAISLVPDHEARMLDPVTRPPSTLRLAGAETSVAPGGALLLVDIGQTTRDGNPAYVLRRADRELRELPASGGPAAVSLAQRLSVDGRFVVRQNRFDQGPVGPGVTLVNLVTGQQQRFGGSNVHAAALSPDNQTLALSTKTRVLVTDVASRESQVVRRLEHPATAKYAGGAVAWSPDGQLIAYQDGRDTLVVDLDGTIEQRLQDARTVNGNQSWSPDSRTLLVYQDEHRRFAAVTADSGQPVPLAAPSEGARPQGWAGTRVVWLMGSPGEQRLVTTGIRRAGARSWVRFVGDGSGIVGVTWSRDLSGSATS